MAIKRRIERLEKNHPTEPEPSALDEFFEKYAEPCEGDEEKEEISKILEMLGQTTSTTGKADPAMATLGEIDGAEDKCR